jgi:hypothetical protein
LSQDYDFWRCAMRRGDGSRILGCVRAVELPELSLRRRAQFIVGFFQYDSRAHLQLDGKALTLPKRVALSGSRYQGKGVTLRITKAGVTTLKHARRPVTTCEQT